MMLRLLDRKPQHRTKRRTEFRSVPVIFANGNDDDTLGLVAAFRNEAVQYEDDIFESGADLEIISKSLVLTRTIWVFGYGHSPERLAEPHEIIIVEPKISRHTAIIDCSINTTAIPGLGS